MAQPEKGQEFWRRRSKHGRDLIFTSPTLLWEACVEYFEATDERKWTKQEWVGKDAKEVERKTDTPYTLIGLFVFLDISTQTWHDYKKREDFIEVCTRVGNIIFTQQFEGASVGAYNANIIARNLGLVDKKDIVTDGKRLKFNVGYKKPE